MDEQNQIIDNYFFDVTIQNFIKERIRSVRTRNQKLKGLVFSCKVIDFPEEHRSNISCFNISSNAEPDFSSSMNAEPDLDTTMECEYEYGPIEVEECQEHLNKTLNGIMVKIQNQQNSSDEVILDCKKEEKLKSVLDRFSNTVGRELSGFTFSNRDHEPFEKSAYNFAVDQLPIDHDADYIEIFYKVIDYESPKRASSEQSPTLKAIAIENDPNDGCSMQFEDHSTGNGEFDMDLVGNQRLSVAIDQIVEIMDLDKPNTQFFTSKGMCINFGLNIKSQI